MYSTNGYIVGHLESAAKDTTHSDYAEAVSCLAKFRAMEVEFFDKVHPLVDIGLAISEVLRAKNGMPDIYTVHGSRHISDLIKSLDKLAKGLSNSAEHSLSVSEAYILLCAAHVHDAANVSGRSSHPQRCGEIIEKYKPLFVSAVYCQYIYNVASVHGGEHPEYGRDTLRILDLDDTETPRLPLLAALLRLADELSENAERVPENVLEKHDHSEMSKLAHAYALSFERFEFRKDSLYIVYNLRPSQRDLVVNLPKGQMSFLKYLEHKIDVIEYEARYCSQYGRPVFNIGQIKIKINEYQDESVGLPVSKLDFNLQLAHGYPDRGKSLCERSPQLRDKKITHIAECFTVNAVDTTTNNDTEE